MFMFPKTNDEKVLWVCLRAAKTQTKAAGYFILSKYCFCSLVILICFICFDFVNSHGKWSQNLHR